jgi:hypothetical protein
MVQCRKTGISLLMIIAVFVALSRSPCAGEGVERVFPLSVELPPSLQGEQALYEEMFATAQRRMMTCAFSHGWKEEVAHPFLVRALIFDSREAFQHEVRRRFSLPLAQAIPGSYAAIIQAGVFCGVSREIYAGQYGGAPERDYYEKLICHELCHELHIRILNYREELMGPVWFYEGFAIYGSGQFEGSIPELTEQEIWKIAESTKRMNYRNYAAMMRFFLRFAALREMVVRAGTVDFVPWLRKKVNQGKLQPGPGHFMIPRTLQQDFHEWS